MCRRTKGWLVGRDGSLCWSVRGATIDGLQGLSEERPLVHRCRTVSECGSSRRCSLYTYTKVSWMWLNDLLRWLGWCSLVDQAIFLPGEWRGKVVSIATTMFCVDCENMAPICMYFFIIYSLAPWRSRCPRASFPSSLLIKIGIVSHQSGRPRIKKPLI